MAKPSEAVIARQLDAREVRRRIYDHALKMKWTVVKDEGDEFQMRTGFTWWTWGELITVSVRGEEITIESRCSPNLKLLDWGKNRRNVNRLKYILAGSEDEPLVER